MGVLDFFKATLPPPEVTVRAEAAREGIVTMYMQGTPVRVPVGEVPKFEALGFVLHQPEDLTSLTSEIEQLAGQLGPQLREFLEGCQKDGWIDPSEEQSLHVVSRLWSDLQKKINLLLTTAYSVYPVRGSDQ